MRDFTFYAPTKIYFGKDTHLQVGQIVKEFGFRRVLLHYGQGSVQRSGLLDAVTDALQTAGVDVVLLGGVEPNPKIGLVRQGVALCKSEGIDLVLAVGGGSVIDSAKAIAAGAVCDVDPWRFLLRETAPKEALPIGTVLTLAASGSEMSASCVISNEEGGLKRSFSSPYNRPLFSILNPELTYSVGQYQTACGVADIMMHTMERYFSVGENTVLTDHIAEGLLRAVIAAGTVALQNPQDYEARATLMWAGSLSHNDLTGCGRSVFMPCHQIEHELSGMYDRVAHGAGLCAIFPAWAKYVCADNLSRFVQFATRVWDVETDSAHPERTAQEGIARTEAFFQRIGMPVRLSELEVDGTHLDEMAEKCTFYGKRVLSGVVPLGRQEILEILQLAL